MADNRGITEFEFTFKTGLQPNKTRLSDAPYVLDLSNAIMYEQASESVETAPGRVSASSGSTDGNGIGQYWANVDPDDTSQSIRTISWRVWRPNSTTHGISITVREEASSGTASGTRVPPGGNITDNTIFSIVRIGGMTMFFNGVDTPFKDSYDYAGTWGVAPSLSNIGVSRPDIETPGKTMINVSISPEAATADVGAFMTSDAGSWTDDTTDANDTDTVGDVNLFPTYSSFDNWLGYFDWKNGTFSDGHYIGYSSRFGGVHYELNTAGTQTATEDLVLEWQFLSERGAWEPLEGVVGRYAADDTEITQMEKTLFTTPATNPGRQVTWTLVPPEEATRRQRWKKQKLNNLGPFYWVRCIKRSGNFETATPTGNYINVFGGDVQGNVKGVVRYFISELTDTTESALSEKIPQNNTAGTLEIDCGEGAAVKVSIDVDSGNGEYANFQSKKFKVYRTYANGYQGFDTGLRLETNSVAEGLVVDEVPDSDLGDLPYLRGQLPPPGIISAVSHYGRVYGLTKEGYVFWSDLANVESWWTDVDADGTPEGNGIGVFVDDNDVGTCLSRDRDGMIVHKKNHMYRILGRVPNQFNLYEITPSDGTTISIGTPSVNSVCSLATGLAFYWNKGVYVYTGGTNVFRISKDIDSELDKINTRAERFVALGFDPNYDHLYVSVPIGDDTVVVPNTTFIYDLRNRKWIGKLPKGYVNFAIVPGEQQISLRTEEIIAKR